MKSKEQLQSRLDGIPDHLLVDMMEQFLEGSIESLCRSSQVCISWNAALAEPRIWRSRLVSRFGPDTSLYHPDYHARFDSVSTSGSDSETHPKEVYAATHTLEKRFSSGSFISRGRFYHPVPITNVALSNGKCFLTDSSGQLLSVPVAVLDNESTQLEDTPAQCLSRALSSPASCLKQLGDKTLLLGHVDGSLSVSNPVHDSDTRLMCHDGRVSGLALQSESRVVSVSSKDATVKISSLDHPAIVETRYLSSASAPNAVTSNDPVTAIVGCRDDKCRFYDFRVPNGPVSEIPMSDWCLCVEASASNPHYMRASDKIVHLFDFRNLSSPIESRHQSTRLISKFKSDDKLRLVSCGLDGELKVSSLEFQDAPVTSLHSSEDNILAADFDRTTLCCGGMNGKFEIFAFN